MDTHEFCTTTAPEILYLALEPITPPDGTGACATHNPGLFGTPWQQQRAFDGEALNPKSDYPAARAMCTACPLLDACRRYADDSREEYTFLAGMTAAERSTRRMKETEIAKRRRQVQELYRIGATTSVIADLVGRDPSLIRGDLRALEKRPGVRRPSGAASPPSAPPSSSRCRR
ncbi:WhiB family transcriptional regulator [Spirillospora sp. CA-128828]|uniref:WhiB family transcriptional regulator n=1 Tax=Spirillospora sp. CA-128828 TaxID=3240033 RepID=UPI003D8DB06B